MALIQSIFMINDHERVIPIHFDDNTKKYNYTYQIRLKFEIIILRRYLFVNLYRLNLIYLKCCIGKNLSSTYIG